MPLQLPPASAALTSPGAIVVDVNGGQVVPSFLGKPLRAVVEEAERAGLEVEISGSGVAREQVPAPGGRVIAGQKVIVKFAR